MRRFLISLGVLTLTVAGGAAYTGVSASAVSAATCTPNVNGQWTAEFNANGSASGGPTSDANTFGNGSAQLTIIQLDTHPDFEWQVTMPDGTPFAYGKGTVTSNMTFKISGEGTPGSPLSTVMASGDLMALPSSPCQPFATSNTMYTATYMDGSSVSNGKAMLTSNTAPGP